MPPIGYQTRTSWADELQLLYWRQMILLTRLARRLRLLLVPIQGYLWMPVVAGLLGLLLGVIITLM